MSTRSECRAANRAAHALKRTQLEEQWALAAAEKQADRKRRRAANRAVWWSRYGMDAPEYAEQIEQVERVELDPILDDDPNYIKMPTVTEDSKVMAASDTRSRGEEGHWFITIDGVDSGTVSWSDTPFVYETPEGELYPCQNEEQARGLAELYAMDYAERSSAVARFKPGMVFGDFEIATVADKSVKMQRVGYADSANRYKIKHDATLGDYVSTKVGKFYASKAEVNAA